MSEMTARYEAEAIEQFADEINKLIRTFDALGLSSAAMDRWNAIPNIEHLDTMAMDIAVLGDTLRRECDTAEEADDRRRDNPLEPDFRRLGQ